MKRVFAILLCVVWGSLSLSSHAQQTSKVTLDDARIMAISSISDPAFIRFVLRPRWSNANPNPTTIEFRVEFIDSSRAILFEDRDSVRVPAFTSDAKTHRIAAVFGKPSDRFEAKAIAQANIYFRASGDSEEKQYRNVPITRTSE